MSETKLKAAAKAVKIDTIALFREVGVDAPDYELRLKEEISKAKTRIEREN